MHGATDALDHGPPAFHRPTDGANVFNCEIRQHTQRKNAKIFAVRQTSLQRGFDMFYAVPTPFAKLRTTLLINCSKNTKVDIFLYSLAE